MKRTQCQGLIVWVCFAAALGALGCAADVDEGSANDAAAGGEVVSTSSEALIGGWATGPHTWSQANNLPTKLPLIADNVCVLTRLSGRFEGMGEKVQLTDDGTNWYLQGKSQQDGVGGEAYCFKRSSFLVSTRVSSEYVQYNFGDPHGCGSIIGREMYAADAFSYLTGLEGAMKGGAEYGLVRQALSPDLFNIIEASSCQDGGLNVLARNFRAGAHTARLAVLMTADGRYVDANNTDSLFTAQGPIGKAEMAPTSKAMCALTQIRGKFAGGGEYVQIRPELVGSEEKWVLRTHRGSASDNVFATARCFARLQLTGI